MIFYGKEGNYYKIKLLGEGTYGKVYLVEDKNKKKFALKSFFGLSNDYDIEYHFGELLRLADNTCPRHVVCLYDKNVSSKDDFLVYELMEGDVSDYHFNIDTILKFMEDSLKGLRWIHTKKLAHNDIKPANILYKEVNGKPVFKIGDLGGLCSSPDLQGFKKECNNFATPFFGAPEVLLRWQEEVNYKDAQKSDIFSLGVTFYYLMNKMILGGEETNYKDFLPYKNLDRFYNEILSKIYHNNTPVSFSWTQNDILKAEFKGKEQEKYNLANKIINFMMRTDPLERKSLVYLLNLFSSHEERFSPKKRRLSPVVKRSKSPTKQQTKRLKRSPFTKSATLRRSPTKRSPTSPKAKSILYKSYYRD